MLKSLQVVSNRLKLLLAIMQDRIFYNEFLTQRKVAKSFPHLKKMEMSQYGDVYGSSEIRNGKFNTNIMARIGNLEEVSWGYKGRGPYTFSLNILYHFTWNKEFAEKYVLDFREDFLANSELHRKDLVIPMLDIVDWIDKKLIAEIQNDRGTHV